MDRLFYIMSLSFMFFGMQSCGVSKDYATTKEAPSIYERVDIMGYDMENMTYEQLMKTVSFARRTPWTDSFWPIYLGGLTWRYNLADGLRLRFPEFKEFFSEFYRRVHSENPKLISQLSPAEKYDLLTLKMGDEKAIMKLVSQIDDLYKEDQKQYVKATAKTQKELDDLGKKLVDASEKENEEEKIKINANIAEKMKENQLAEKRVIQRLYSRLLNADLLKQNFPLVLDGWVGWAYYAGSGSYSVTGKTEGELIDWSWMGNCHGWAPAAIYEDKPEQAVMVKRGGMKIIFTEGDIRGLLSKAWGNQAPAAKFIGLRCNETPERIAINEVTGRILDGFLCKLDDRKCIAKFSGRDDNITQYFGDFRKEVLFVPDGRPIKIYSYNEYAVISEPDENQMHKSARRTSDERQYMVRYEVNTGIKDLPEFGHNIAANNVIRDHHFAAYVFTSKAQILAAIRDNRWQNIKQSYFYLTGCRSVNPATFHIALTNFFVDSTKGGFVIDRTPTAEVWNQPVVRFNLKAGNLIDVRTISDPLESLRAYGTKYLLEVTGELWYEDEPQRPYAIYEIDDGRSLDEMLLRKAPLSYTLEFDYKHKILGGEWGNLAESQSRLPVEAPDFIYWYEKGEKPKIKYPLRTSAGALLGYYDLRQLNKIHSCSVRGLERRKTKIPAVTLLSIPNDTQLDEVWNKEFEITYVDCPL